MTDPPAIVIQRYTEVDSTSSAARRLLDEPGNPRRFAVVADAQTAGRGTRGRNWSSPAGAGLYMTYVDADERIPGAGPVRTPTTTYTLAAGIACAEAIEQVTGVRIALKPVNDLMVADRKLGGILTETIIRGGTVTALMVGIGINLRPIPYDPASMPCPPISISELPERAPGIPPDRDVLLHAVLHRLLRRIEDVERGNESEIARVFGTWTARK